MRLSLTSHPWKAWDCSCPEGSCWSACMVPPGTSEDMGQQRGEKRADRCHQALLQRWAQLLHPMYPIHHGQWQTLINSSCTACISLPVWSVSADEFTHTELGRGYTRSSGKLRARKTLHPGFSVDVHKRQNSGGRGLFSVVCGCGHGNEKHKLELLYDSWGLPTRDSHSGQLILWKQNTAEAIQGHSCSNFIISVNTKIRHRALKRSPHGEIAHGCMQVAWLPLPWDNDGQFSTHLWAVVKTQPCGHLLVMWLLQYRIVFHCKKEIKFPLSSGQFLQRIGTMQTPHCSIQRFWLCYMSINNWNAPSVQWHGEWEQCTTI